MPPTKLEEGNQWLDIAMTMPGGGTFGASMIAGQYTDDT